MRQRKHPLSGAIYDVRADGLVEVRLNGEAGLFTHEGEYVSGHVHHADPHLCLWLAGPQVPAHVARNPKDLPSIARARATTSTTPATATTGAPT